MDVFYEKGKKYNFRSTSGTPYYRMTVTIDGKRKQVYGDGEKDAKKKVEELKATAKSGVDVSHDKAKVGDVFNYWLYSVKRVDKNIKASSFARYDCAYRSYIKDLPVTKKVLSKLSSANMQEYITGLYEEHGASGAAIQSTVKVWKMFLKWAIDEGYIAKDPCRNLSMPGEYDKSKKVIETFTDDERSRLQQYMTDTDYEYDTVIKLAFATGMRMGELFGLRWSDVHDHAIYVSRSTGVVSHVDKDGNRERYREIWDTKTVNSVRTIPILPRTETMLKEHEEKQAVYFAANKLGEPEYVFTTLTGKLIDPSSFTKSYRRLLKRAEIPYRKFHAIRHTFATQAIRHGVDIKDLQLLMGHADIETTYIYVQSDETSKRSAIERMGDII